MRFEKQAAAGFLVVFASLWFGYPSGALTGLGSRTSGASGEVVFVANADSGPVTAYGAASSGSVAPVRTLDNPKLDNTFWDPWTVAVDSSSRVYIQTFISDATSFVFPSSSSGRPSRVFRVTGPDSQSIAVDENGFEYVMGGEGPPQVFVAAPNADGKPANGYSVRPVREFPTGQDGVEPWASTLSVDKQGEVIAAITKVSGNSVEVFRGGATGGSQPVRTIAGSRTDLGNCAGYQACDHVSVTSSLSTGRIYVAVSSPLGTHIDIFAPGATGNVEPERTIRGKMTGLTGNVVTGIAESQATGDVFVMVKASQFGGPAEVEVFGRHADGNVAPLRSFTDRMTGFEAAQGIAVGDEP
jgi:hypothetical protein